MKVVYTGPDRKNLAAVTHRIAPVPATHMTHRVASDVRDASRSELASELVTVVELRALHVLSALDL